MALALPAQAATVVHDPGRVTLANSGKILSGQEYRLIKAEQRTGQNYWKSEWAFPSGDVLERESLLVLAKAQLVLKPTAGPCKSKAGS